MHQTGANPVAVLQIDGRNHAPSAVDFFAVSMQEIDAFGTKSKIVDFEEQRENMRRARLKNMALRRQCSGNYRCLHTV